MSGGRIAYRIKKIAHGAREKVRVMTPLEFLARLSALIPPPRYPLVRYHGVLLAPARRSWRARSASRRSMAVITPRIERSALSMSS
jgi:hypothetical protein